MFSCKFCEISRNTFPSRTPLGDCFGTYFMQRQAPYNNFIIMMVQINTIIFSFDAFLRWFYLHQVLLPTIITRIEIDSHWTRNEPSRFRVINVEDVGHNTGNKNRLCKVTISFMSLQITIFFDVRACTMKTPLINLTVKVSFV